MEIIEVEYIYYGEKCSKLEGVAEQIELKLFDDNINSVIYLEKKLNSLEEIIKEESTIVPVVKINGEILKATGEIICEECSKKYGFEVKHNIYYSSEQNLKKGKKSEIEHGDIEKILCFKECCGGGCNKGCK